jgi:hypothetical protein
MSFLWILLETTIRLAVHCFKDGGGCGVQIFSGSCYIIVEKRCTHGHQFPLNYLPVSVMAKTSLTSLQPQHPCTPDKRSAANATRLLRPDGKECTPLPFLHLMLLRETIKITFPSFINMVSYYFEQYMLSIEANISRDETYEVMGNA